MTIEYLLGAGYRTAIANDWPRPHCTNMIWVQLRSVKQIDRAGDTKTFHAGDWVQVGDQLALSWLHNGSAWIPPERVQKLMFSGCGIAALRSIPGEVETMVQTNDKLSIKKVDEPELPFPLTLLWDSRIHLRPELIPVGFALLDTWQVAAPLWDYDELACQIGSDEDRTKTKEVVRDLRVPLYDPGLIFMRRCGDTQKLVETWKAEGGDEKLAFLRALYQTKPMILALPVTWAGKQGPPED